MAVAVGRAGRGRSARAVKDRELHHGIEQAQRLVVGDMLLRLRGQKIWQAQMGRGVRHGDSRGLGSELQCDRGGGAAAEAVRELVDADRQHLAGR